MSRRRDERAVRVEAHDLLEEAVAILSGRVAQCCGPGETVPGWMRVNQLAHADWADVAGLADQTEPTRRSAWDGAVSFLAAELLSAAGNPAGLLELQRASLIPLELDMLAIGSTPGSPTELVQRVRDQLARARARRIHPGAS